MKRLREYLRNWLLGDLTAKVDALELTQAAIESHLGSISSLAEYVKEKEEKAAELFVTMAEVNAGKDISAEDLESAIQDALGTKVAILDSPAIGTTEVIAKNQKLGEIDVYIKGLTAKRSAYVN